MDGLLVDTETCDYVAWRELFAVYDLPLTVEEYCHHAGLYGSWDRLYGQLARVTGADPVALHARRDPRFRALVLEAMPPGRELLRLLEELAGAGVPLGIASSSDRDWVEHLLDGSGLRRWFEVVVTGHDVSRRKPAPDVYLQALEALGARPEESVALEDSTHGVQAARAAGMKVVAVPNPISARQDLSLAHRLASGFAEIDLDLLTRLFEPEHFE
jgi:putative hydrolase of the HAD superfamily